MTSLSLVKTDLSPKSRDQNYWHIDKSVFNVFGILEKHMTEKDDSIMDGDCPHFITYGKWKEVLAWKPIEINGKKHWLNKVWRRFVYDSNIGSYWEYTTLQDYLANHK